MKRLSLILLALAIATPAFADSPKRKPIKIPEPHALRILKVGELAGIAQVCGIGWAGYYIEFLKSERRKGIWTDVQLKNVIAIFSFAQSKAVREAKTCSAAQKEENSFQLKNRTNALKIKKGT